MMNGCAYQQNALGVCGDLRRGDSISVYNGVVCPKPRRLFISSSMDDQIRPTANFSCQQADVSESRAGTELLDMILRKESYGAEMASTPPFFWGSPPSRASNPVIQDRQFGNDKPSLVPEASSLSSLSSSACKQQGGCVRAKLGQSPAAVQIEGFNCRENCSISAVA